ncbi:hypothetical protein E3N88_36513 [Mikania micrantha]|uniref:PORR domain-containing protein n=1 Tax=Mikania micrantha TaxID=192012 RepID=A0A5N6M6N9_9ASTR|nr:hypothetical protein E3N88_36513 [Mikania micrantha]
MMSKDNVVSTDKLVHVKREFGFPNDFLVNLVPKYPDYFRLVGNPGEGNSFLELVSWNPRFAKSVIEQRADEESELTGVKIRPSFNWKLPPGFLIRKEMREWIRDWMERPYISPYDDASKLDQASQEMEKRTVGVFHELLSLSLYKRIPVPILGKFTEEYRFSNAFSTVFTRHSGIFYTSLKGGIKTAMLREAYKGDELIDRDPLLKVNDNFVELLDEGHKQREEQLNLQKQAVKNEIDMFLLTAMELIMFPAFTSVPMHSLAFKLISGNETASLSNDTNFELKCRVVCLLGRSEAAHDNRGFIENIFARRNFRWSRTWQP